MAVTTAVSTVPLFHREKKDYVHTLVIAFRKKLAKHTNNVEKRRILNRAYKAQEQIEELSIKKNSGASVSTSTAYELRWGIGCDVEERTNPDIDEADARCPQTPHPHHQSVAGPFGASMVNIASATSRPCYSCGWLPSACLDPNRGPELCHRICLKDCNQPNGQTVAAKRKNNTAEQLAPNLSYKLRPFPPGSEAC